MCVCTTQTNNAQLLDAVGRCADHHRGDVPVQCADQSAVARHLSPAVQVLPPQGGRDAVPAANSTTQEGLTGGH